jgi:hypothetical protein
MSQKLLVIDLAAGLVKSVSQTKYRISQQKQPVFPHTVHNAQELNNKTWRMECSLWVECEVS